MDALNTRAADIGVGALVKTHLYRIKNKFAISFQL